MGRLQPSGDFAKSVCLRLEPTLVERLMGPQLIDKLQPSDVCPKLQCLFKVEAYLRGALY